MLKWILTVLVTLALGCALGVQAADYYVATDGSDAWSGKLGAPNAGRTDGPFGSIEKARAVIRKQSAGRARRDGQWVVHKEGHLLPREHHHLRA